MQGSFWVWALQMKDGVIMQRRVSLDEPMTRMITVWYMQTYVNDNKMYTKILDNTTKFIISQKSIMADALRAVTQYRYVSIYIYNNPVRIQIYMCRCILSYNSHITWSDSKHAESWLRDMNRTFLHMRFSYATEYWLSVLEPKIVLTTNSII